MSIEKIIVKERKTTGKEESGRIRRQGMVPAVVYGLGKDAVPISVSPKLIVKVLQSEKGMNSLLELSLENSTQTAHVMIKDMAHHPVSDRLVHVDFLRVNMDKEIESHVPVFYTGIPIGAKLGGILQVIRHEILVSCLPNKMPGKLEFSVEHLKLDESLRVGDVQAPEGVTFQLEPFRVLAVVHEQNKTEEVAEEGEAAADIAVTE